MQFERGQQVTYTSGGPVMTMEYQDPITFKVTCGWFEGSKFNRAEFDLDTLEEWHQRTVEPEDAEYDPLRSYR